MPLKSALFKGSVLHRRLHPGPHLLQYDVTYCYFDLDELDQLEKNFRLFSKDKRNIISLRSGDLGYRDDAPLKDQIIQLASLNGIEGAIDKITLLHIPRIWGQSFNPLTTYFLYDAEELLVGLIYEVNNTFGEQHRYVIPVATTSTGRVLRHDCPKEFYVSPFFPENGHYQFALKIPQEDVALSIKLESEGTHSLNASFVGKRVEMTTGSLFSCYASTPLLGIKVITAIHWEALKLWLKGNKIVSRSETPGLKAPLEGKAK